MITIIRKAAPSLPNASDQYVFEKGDRLTLRGPNLFPFALECEVIKRSRRIPSRTESVTTRLKPIHGTLASIVLEHWIDTSEFSISVEGDSRGIFRLVNELTVTVEPFAHALHAYKRRAS